MIKNISFENLKVLIAVAESKNFYEAAGKLQITQPSVSQRLKELESQLPLELFQLEGKRKVLTHYGRSLYDVAKAQALLLEKGIEGLHRQYASAENLTLRVGGRSEVLEYAASQFKFAGKIELRQLNSTEAVKNLLAHEIDIAVTYSLPDSTDIVAKKLFHSSSQFIAHQDILGKSKLSLDLLKNKNFIQNTPCIIYRQDGHLLGDWLKHLGISMSSINIKYVTEDWRTVVSLVNQGAGYALVPEYINLTNESVKTLEMPTSVLPKYTFYALYERGLKKIEAFKEVLAFELKG